MSNIRDMFCVCNVNLYYDHNSLTFILNDIESGRLVKIYSEENNQNKILKRVYTCLDNYINDTNEFPGSILLVGDFYYDEDVIYWHIDDTCMFTFLQYTFLSCYIDADKATNDIVLKDRLTNNIVNILDASDEFYELKYYILNKSIENIYSKYNYFNHGKLNLLITGKLVSLEDNTYTYQHSESTMFGDIEVLYEEMLSLLTEKL